MTLKTSLIQAAKAYRGTPREIAAWQWLESGLPSEVLDHFGSMLSAPPAIPTKPKGYKEYATAVRALNLSQPDARTCQSACIAMAVRDPNILGIRHKLERIGEPGSTAVMGSVIRSYGVDYEFTPDASLADVRNWLKAGEFLITHGWFTGSGHVICLDGVAIDEATLSYKLNVKDPWSEFDGPSWSYRSQSKFYDGYYSSHMIYAACVESSSMSHAARIYRQGKLDSARGGMWVHRIKNS